MACTTSIVETHSLIAWPTSRWAMASAFSYTSGLKNLLDTATTAVNRTED